MVALALAALLLLPALYLILTGNNNGRAAFDATAYHLRFIRDLTAQFPNFDLSNPLTATTPGYHILLATVAQVGGSSLVALRLTSALIGCAFVGLAAFTLARRTRPSTALFLGLPLVASIYVVGSAAWTVPDNLAWLCVTAILALALHPASRRWHLALACAVLVALVLARQIHIWAAAMVWIAAFANARARGRSFAAAVLAATPWFVATIPAFGTLWLFMRHWGGLTPPRFQNELQGLNLATPAFILLQVAILCAGFLPWVIGPVRRAWQTQRGMLILAGICGVLLAALPVTTASFEAGRFSGWWALVERAPVLAGRTSLLMLVASPLGAISMCALLLGLPARERTILGVSLLAFTAALTSNYYCWQRYHEPLLLVVLPLMCVMQREARSSSGVRDALFPLALAVVLGIATVQGVRGERIPDDALPATHHFAPGDPFAPHAQ